MRWRKSRGWHLALSNHIWDRDEGHCIYCGAPAQHIDHVVPVSRGGPTRVSNGVLACRACNMRKSNKLPFDMLVRAFFHLLMHGEDIDWLDALWAEAHADEPARKGKHVREDTVPYGVQPEPDAAERAKDAARKALEIIKGNTSGEETNTEGTKEVRKGKC